MADINGLVTIDSDTIQENMISATILLDNNGRRKQVPENSSTFETIKKGDDVSIVWGSATRNGMDAVEITGINEVKGDDASSVLRRRPADDTWLAAIMNHNGDHTLEGGYNIVCTVSNKPGETFTLLDPTITVEPT